MSEESEDLINEAEMKASDPMPGRRCAKCHAVLADGPQPGETYPCPGCDGYECAKGCRYPGVARFRAEGILRQIDAASFMDGTMYEAILAAKRFVASTLPQHHSQSDF